MIAIEFIDHFEAVLASNQYISHIYIKLVVFHTILGTNIRSTSSVGG